MDISPDADLDKIFRPLENCRTSEMLLGKEKAMQEREHTLVELARMEKVRRFLINNDIADKDSFMDFLNEIL